MSQDRICCTPWTFFDLCCNTVSVRRWCRVATDQPFAYWTRSSSCVRSSSGSPAACRICWTKKEIDEWVWSTSNRHHSEVLSQKFWSHFHVQTKRSSKFRFQIWTFRLTCIKRQNPGRLKESWSSGDRTRWRIGKHRQPLRSPLANIDKLHLRSAERSRAAWGFWRSFWRIWRSLILEVSGEKLVILDFFADSGERWIQRTLNSNLKLRLELKNGGLKWLPAKTASWNQELNS